MCSLEGAKLSESQVYLCPIIRGFMSQEAYFLRNGHNFLMVGSLCTDGWKLAQ